MKSATRTNPRLEAPTTLDETLPAPIPPEPAARDGRVDRRNYLRSAYSGEAEDALQRLALRRMVEYRVDALDAIFDLATMPISDNSAQNQVKLAAARLLAAIDGAPKSPEDGGLEGMLRNLNEAYHKDAPRIRSVRERIVTFESELPPIEQ